MRHRGVLAALVAAVLTSLLLAADGREAAAREPGPGVAGTFLRRINLVGNALDLSTGTTADRRSPAVAYNSRDNEYMVVWSGYQDPNSYDIVGQRVSAGGGLQGANFPVITLAESQTDPSVAYNSTDNQYLVAWRTQQSGFFNAARGRRLSRTGPFLGSDFFIADAGSRISTAYSATANEFLVTGHGLGMWGRRVSAGGSLEGSEIVISSSGAEKGRVVYNPNANEYFATWRDHTDENLQGRRISATGTLLGSPTIISPVYPGGERGGSVAFDSAGNRYLVVFSEPGEHRILGQFVSGSGGLDGGNFAIASELEISPGGPHVAYSAADNAFVIVWQQGDDIMGRLLYDGGAVLGASVRIARGTASGEPALAHNSRTGEFLVVWRDDRNESVGEMDIYGQLLDIVPVDAGDADCSGDVSAIDAALVLQHNAGLIDWTLCMTAADVNSDGSLNAVDAALILQYVAGLIGVLPP